MKSPFFIVSFIFFAGLYSALPAAGETVTLLSGYEPSETGVTVTSGEVTITRLPGGTIDGTYGAVPNATQAGYVLGLIWTGQPDRKVEIRHDFTTTFDLDNADFILVDCYFPVESSIPIEPDGIIGIWDDVFGWLAAGELPWETDVWFTVQLDVTGLSNTGLDHISALVWENMGSDGDSAGTIFIDNLRLIQLDPPNEPNDISVAGHDSRIDLRWDPVTGLGFQGYNIYRADSQSGPFAKINTSLHNVSVYSDFLGENGETKYYYITSVGIGGESGASQIVSATSYAMNDSELLTSVQEATFRYFWDFGHPVSGLAREGFLHDRDTCTTGGSGMGIMTIIVGAERGFITRSQAAEHILKMLTFLDEEVSRFHGAWSHWLNGTTGATIPFGGSSPEDNGGDLVETAFLIQGMLTARQYFDSVDPVETEIRTRATQMWEDVEWDWYRRYPGGDDLYWHWSPDHGWAMNMTITGYNEAMIVYLLAIASPTHPMPASSYYNGWAKESWYQNNDPIYYGIKQWVGTSYGGPLFFTHYSFLGFDPRYKYDAYCNYFENSRNISLLHQAYCIDNPGGYEGYSSLVWGLTASWDPFGYTAHEPMYNDNGTITPTAAISAMPYTPVESIATLKHFYHTYGNWLWGTFGFTDAFNLDQDPNWFSDTYLAIDQGPIVPMIENYRTQLCWNLFMANPEIEPMLTDIGWTCSGPDGDLNNDCQIDINDLGVLALGWLGDYDLSDLAQVAGNWLECTKFDTSQCFVE